MNPLMQSMGLGGLNSQAIGQVRQMMHLIQTAQNPQQAMMQAAQSNPTLNSVLQMCNGKSPKEVFYGQCKQMGVNPDEVINALK